MFFTKGEIIMNNIYKVIWSKAKNCYVVASEIARSHTKSASGSEKIGGVTRRSLLASLMALSLLCGGLGVASAANSTVHVDESASGAAEVYTKTGVDTLLAEYGRKEDVENNRNSITTLQNTTTDQGQKITANTTDIANIKTAIDKKIDTVTADARYATRTELIAKADATALDTKADKDTVTALDRRVGVVEGKVTALETTVGDDSNGLVREVNELKNQGNTLNNALGNKADKSELDAAKEKITTNETNINALQTKTAKLSPDGTKLTGMNSVETGALKVTGQISDGANVNTTLAKIDASMKQTETNKGDIADLKKKTNTQQTWIGRLNDRTTNITHDATGTSVDGVTFNAGAVTGVKSINGIDIGDAQVDMKGKNLTGVGTINGTVIGTNTDGEYIRQDNSIWGNMKKVDTQVKTNADAIAQEKTDREKAIGNLTEDKNYIKKDKNVSDNLVELDKQAKTNADAIAQEKTDREKAIGNLTEDKNYIKKDKNVSDNLVELDKQAKANADKIVKTNERTGGITRNTEKTQTTIEGSVKVDNQGNVKDVKGLSAETITTTGNATIGGDLKVAGTITTKKMVFGDPATNNYTEIDQGKVTSKNSYVNGEGQLITSSSIFNAEENKVGFANNATGDQSFHKQTSDIIMDNVKDQHNSNNRTQTKTETKDIITDENGNSSTTSQTASENKTYLKDKDGKNTNSTIDTAKGYDKTIKGENGQTSTKQDELNITNTAQNGTITNDAQNIVNNASGNITNKANTMDTNVTGKATESYGELETEVKGNEKHTVKGDQTNEVDGKQINTIKNGQENIISGGQTNTITGGQINNITGDQTTNVSGTQTTTATDINRNASSSMVDKVDNAYGTNTETKEAGKTTTDVSIKGTGEKGQYIRGANESRDYLIKGTLKNEETKTAEVTSTEITDGTNKASTIQDAKNLAGSVTNGTETGVSGIHANDDGSVSIDSAVAGGGMSSVINQKKDSIQSAVGDGTNSTVIHQDKDNVTIASSNGMVGLVGKDIVNNAQDTITNTAGTSITNQVNDSKVTTDANGTTFENKTAAVSDGGMTTTKINGNHINTGRIDANELGVSDKDGANTADFSVKAGEGVKASAGNGTTTGSLDVKADEVVSSVTNTDGTHTNMSQTADGIKGYATDKDGNKTYTKVTATENSFQVQDKDGKNKNHQVNTMGSSVTEITDKDGNTTKTEQTATDITNEASNSITDKVGTNTRVLNKDGITDTVGGSTFKQRINAIMMESKDVSIKAEETLTNEAKVITNKASEVINNEAVNINNTATGIITSKASEIKNQADKLISNKVGENTWENMEDGKITTSIKDGTKQNLTQSDAAGTTQSTVDGVKSTVTIQNADGLTDVVTDGKNTSIQNQTAFAIQAAVKDKAGNENASLTDVTTSANTIKNGTKANTVISTADGTSFINSEAAAPVTGASGAGTHLNTTIKGNTITTGKVTMDYAEVMKDLGVHGSAKVDNNLEVGGITTTKTLNVTENATVGGTTTTKTLNVTEDAKVGRDLAVDGNATIKGDVTARSYKVDGKTYISAAGINANDQKITNVADGSISEGSKDAVNGGQLYGVKNDLEGKVNKVGANAAAMANLHPMEFDPDSKWNIAAAIGNYGSETAAALGAFYRPNDDVMVNLSTAFGTGENMVGGGVSVRLGKGGNKLSREESNALKDQVNDLTARMDALLSVLNPNMSKDFPDVPENHWAYEAVSRLAGNDIVQGYPDGEFHGERTMTRYEMAEIIYNALSRGAEAEKELVEEFKPELQAMAASEKATAERAEG